MRYKPETKRSRWKGRKHVGLLCYIALLVIGSSVWLNLVIGGQADRTGGVIRRAAWARGGRGDHRATAIDLEFVPNMDTCSFDDAIGGDGVESTCSSTEPFKVLSSATC